MKSFISILLGVLLSAPFSHAIGRSGNGKIADGFSAFTAEVPNNFPIWQQDGANLMLENPGVFNFNDLGPILQPEFIWLNEFRTTYREQENLARQQLHDFFVDKGFRVLALEDPCIEAFIVENESAITAVTSWGGGKGLVVVAQNYAGLEDSIIGILQSIKLNQGACSWK